MVDKVRESTAQAVILPKKQILSEETLLEVWETRGLKYRVDEFYKHCAERGLLPHFRINSFRSKIYKMLEQFLVDGETRRDPRFVPPPKKRKVY